CGVFRDSFPGTALELAKGKVFDALSTSSLAYAATLPLMAFYFGAASLVAIPANLAVVLPAMILVGAGMGVFAIDLVCKPLGEQLARGVLDPIVRFLQWIVELFGNLSISSVPVAYLSGYVVALIYLALGIAFVRERV